jgi:hypothetical protein
MVGRRRKRTEDVANWAKKLRTKSRVKSFSVIVKFLNIVILFDQRLLVKYQKCAWHLFIPSQAPCKALRRFSLFGKPKANPKLKPPITKILRRRVSVAQQ